MFAGRPLDGRPIQGPIFFPLSRASSALAFLLLAFSLGFFYRLLHDLLLAAASDPIQSIDETL
jgi:hypothetical protein